MTLGKGPLRGPLMHVKDNASDRTYMYDSRKFPLRGLPMYDFMKRAFKRVIDV